MSSSRQFNLNVPQQLCALSNLLMKESGRWKSFFMGSILLILVGFSAVAQGLDPFTASSPTQNGELKLQPSGGALVIRVIQPGDKVVILRTDGDWQEAQVTSADGLVFQGWIQGEVKRIEKPELPALPVNQTAKDKPNPLKSDRWKWFWNGDLIEKARFRFGLGLQNIAYDLSGVVPTESATASRAIYRYQFSGFSFEPSVEFPVSEFLLKDRIFRWSLGASYSMAFYALQFAADEKVSQLAGTAYEIRTTTFDLQSLIEADFFKDWTLGLGLGFYGFQTSPDIAQISTTDIDNQTPFSDTSFYSIALPLVVRYRFKDKILSALRFNLFPFGQSIDEQIGSTPPYTVADFPFSLDFSFDYSAFDRLGVFAKFHWVSMQGNATAGGSRLGTTYAESSLLLTNWRILAGPSLKF